ncbi:putative protein 22 [Rhizopogon vesiculosus]|uniref:DUF6535 domain-containing protein n=1 Tax=Rhizopogon vesiculosus TaxID=180088 RepID=A0A1J8QVJ8_9AGAM|nr:putative protein 22 [Rhizopogon vesiculosus]
MPPDLSIPQLSQSQPSVLTQDNKTQAILQDILKTLQDSSITEKEDKDIQLRFWATYSKVSKEHDDEFLERSNSDMDIVLIFSGLFSAINTAFIIAMQPSYTNILLSQLVQNTSPNGTISSVPGSGTDSTAATWFQGFAYIALSFSLLAAFGAVLGKQWLSHYKANGVHGSLEERGKHRQQKLDGLEAWYFDAMLKTFPVLLQISLLLFALALSAFVWSQQGALAVAVIVPTAFGIVLYTFVVIASLISLRCPFQTPVSTLIRFLWRRHIKICAARLLSGLHRHGHWGDTWSSPSDTVTRELGELLEARSVEWILETSTNPEVITSVARLLPTIKWIHKLYMPSVSLRLLSTYRTCFLTGFQLSVSARQRALACGRAFHHVICNDETIQDLSCWGDNDQDFDLDSLDLWSSWHDIALPWSLDACRASFDKYATKNDENRGNHEDQARSALRFAITTGCPGFSMPNDVTLIWDGVFDWNNEDRAPKDFDWLVDYLVHFRTSGARNFDTMADALLALSALQGLGSPEKRDNYLDAIIFSMEVDNPFRLRHAALRAVSDARLQLVEIADDKERDSKFLKKLLTDLPSALLTTTKLVAPQLSEHDPDAIFNPGRDYFYLRLIFTLAKQSDWRDQLEAAGHIDRCVVLLDHVINLKNFSTDEPLEALPSIVTYTLESLETKAAIYDSTSLVRVVDRIYEALKVKEARPDIISAVQSVKDWLGLTIVTGLPGARNFDVIARALLAPSNMQGSGSLKKRDNYLDAIIFSMEADKPFRLRHAALRAVFDARLQLVKIADDKEGDPGLRKRLLKDLPSALLTTTKLVAPQLSDHDPDAIFNPGHDYFYLRLIFTLAKQSDWRDRLEKAGHIDRCVFLLDHVTNLKDFSTGSSELVKNHPYYLAGALIRLDTSGSYRNSSFADKISELEWWQLLKGAWSAMWWNVLYCGEELLEALPSIITYTLESLETGAAKYDSKSLVRVVDRIYDALKDKEAQPGIISVVKSVKDRLDSSGS